MRLFKQIVIKKISKLDEATLKNKDTIAYHYQIIGFCSKLAQIKIPNIGYKNNLYKLYKRRQLLGQNTMQLRIKLQELAETDHILIEKFLNTVKDIREDTIIHDNFWIPGIFAIFSYEDD